MASRRVPKNAVDVDLQQIDRRVRPGHRREVLVVGELGKAIRSELAERGAALTLVERIYDAFMLLADRDFDVVVVNPLVEGSGLDFVNAVKEGPVEHELTLATLYGIRWTAKFLRGVRPPSPEALDAVRARHASTPFVVLPTDEWEYAVIVVPPHASFVRDAREVPLVTAILSVNPAKLLGTAEPMA